MLQALSFVQLFMFPSLQVQVPRSLCSFSIPSCAGLFSVAYRYVLLFIIIITLFVGAKAASEAEVPEGGMAAAAVAVGITVAAAGTAILLTPTRKKKLAQNKDEASFVLQLLKLLANEKKNETIS